MMGALKRGIGRMLTAALCLAGTAQLIGRAQAFDILDMAQPPPPAAPGWVWGRPLNLRFEGGAGYNNGGTDTTVSSPGLGSVSTNLIGGGGLAAEAAVWSDTLWFPGISVGAQYLHFDHSSSVTATSAAGPVFGLTSASASLNLDTNAAMFNVAWRPQVQLFHPFIGAGVGAAFTDLSASSLGFSASNSQTALAGQAFFGFDYDIAPNIYAGLTGRFFISEATYHVTSVVIPNGSQVPVRVQNNIDITNRPISLMAHVGVQF